IGKRLAEEITRYLAGGSQSATRHTPPAPQPAHTGLGQLLPHGGCIQDVSEVGSLDVPPYRALSETPTSSQAESLVYPALLGPAEPHQAEGSVGLWRQSHRSLFAEVRLVSDRASCPGPKYGFPRRPTSTGILVGTAKDQHSSSARQ